MTLFRASKTRKLSGNQKRTAPRLTSWLVVITSVLGAAVLFGCEEPKPCTVNMALRNKGCGHRYVCENGTPARGRTTTANVQKCAACNDGYEANGDICMPAHEYVCTNGTPASGRTNTVDTQKCASCDTGYTLTDDMMCTKDSGEDLIFGIEWF